MNAIKLFAVVFAIAVVALFTFNPTFGQGTPPVAPGAPVVAAPVTMPFSGQAFGKGIGAGLVLIGAAYGFGKIGSAALESMARQPETANKVQTAMIIIGALLEGATFFALIVTFTI